MTLRSSIVLLAAALSLGACSSEKDLPSPPESTKVAILLAPSGKGDKSYNDMAIAGISDAKAKLPQITVTEILPPKPADYEPIIRKLATSDTDLVIGVGFLYTDAIKNLAPSYKATKFLLLDGDAGDLPNVRSVVYRPEEGCFLVGAIAAAKTKTGKVGFIAGMDIPIMRRFECGFADGVKKGASDRGVAVTVETRYIGSTPDAFSNPSRGREIAALMYERNTDIIFHAAGRSGNGVIQAAKEMNRFAIGVDTDQSYLAPQAVITSMRKRLDHSISGAIEDVVMTRFNGGVSTVGLKEKGVDYVPGGQVDASLKNYIDRLGAQIIAGRILPCEGQTGGH